MHRRIAAAAVRDVMLAARSLFDRVRAAILAADETFDRPCAVSAALATTGGQQTSRANHHTNQANSIHQQFSAHEGIPFYVYATLMPRRRTANSDNFADHPRLVVPSRASATKTPRKKGQLRRARRRLRRATRRSVALCPSAKSVAVACSSARATSLRRCS